MSIALEAGAAVDLLVGPGEQAPGIEQWLRGCLVAPLPAPSLELDHRLEWRPHAALDAPRLLPAGRYLQESLGLTITLLEIPRRGPLGAFRPWTAALIAAARPVGIETDATDKTFRQLGRLHALLLLNQLLQKER